MTVMRYPAGTRWLDYDKKRRSRRDRSVSRETLRVITISIGAAAAAWGLMHLALRLLG